MSHMKFVALLGFLFLGHVSFGMESEMKDHPDCLYVIAIQKKQSEGQIMGWQVRACCWPSGDKIFLRGDDISLLLRLPDQRSNRGRKLFCVTEGVVLFAQDVLILSHEPRISIAQACNVTKKEDYKMLRMLEDEGVPIPPDGSKLEALVACHTVPELLNILPQVKENIE